MIDALFIVLFVPLTVGDSKPAASCVHDGKAWETTVGWTGARRALRGVIDMLRVKRANADGAITWELTRKRDDSVLWHEGCLEFPPQRISRG